MPLYAYKKFTNLAPLAMLDGYRPGDALCLTWIDTVEVEPGAPITVVPEILFARHNRDDRPDGALCPSMSVGDVVTICEARDDDGALVRSPREWSFAAASVGFALVDRPRSAQVVTDWWAAAFDIAQSERS